MIEYKYNLRVDIGRQIWVFKNRSRQYDYKAVPKYPTLGRVLKLLFWPPQMPKVETNDNEHYQCYFTSGGNLGGWYGPRTIFICPFDVYSNRYLSQQELKNILIHEITHLRYLKETKDLSFEEREKIINKKQSMIKNN